MEKHKEYNNLQALDLVNSKARCLADLLKVDALVGVGLARHGNHSEDRPLRSSLHQEVVRIQFTIWKNTNHSGGNTDSHWGADLATWPDQHLARGQFSAKMEQNWRSGEKLWYNKTCANYFPYGLFYLKMAYIGPQCVSIGCPESWRAFQKLQIFVRACKSIAWISSVHWRQNHSVQKILVYPCNKLIYIVRIVPNLEKWSSRRSRRQL